MLSSRSFLSVADNSGAKIVRCLKVIETRSSFGRKHFATIGDVILVSIRFCAPHKKVKKGSIYRGLIIRTNRYFKREVGFLNLMQNSIILFDKKMQPLGTRIFGPVAKESHFKRFNKLITFIKLEI